jgi:hypothetical protein
MTEEEIRAEIVKIAVAEIGKKHVVRADVETTDDFGDGEQLQISVKLRPDAPSSSGDTYVSILLKARDFLASIGDARRPSILLERSPNPNLSLAK